MLSSYYYIWYAVLSSLGSRLYKPSTSDKSIRVSALTICATLAPRRSLSPNLSSLVVTVSFSLIMGTTFSDKSVEMLLLHSGDGDAVPCHQVTREFVLQSLHVYSRHFRKHAQV